MNAEAASCADCPAGEPLTEFAQPPPTDRANSQRQLRQAFDRFFAGRDADAKSPTDLATTPAATTSASPTPEVIIPPAKPFAFVPRQSSQAGVLGTLEYDPALMERSARLPAADTREAAPTSVEILAGSAAVAGAILAAILLFQAITRLGWRRFSGDIMQYIRQRAALVICVGAGIVAADWLVLGQLTRHDDFWHDLHRDHWIAMTGVAISLVGIFHWIARPTEPKS